MDFKHGGLIGDCIYSLPTIRYLGGGKLYLETEVGHFKVGTAEALLPLLKTAGYLTNVSIVGKGPSGVCDFNRFREGKKIFQQHLTWTHGELFGVPHEAYDAPWLSVKPYRMAPIIISRSLKPYARANFPWARAMEHWDLRNKGIFVGFPEEHDDFCKLFGHVDRFPTNDMLEVAELIQGADLFIGNQGAPLAVAEALGKPVVVENATGQHTLPFRSSDAVHK